MNKDKYVFAQMVEFLDNYKFLRIVKKYDGNRYIKHFTCWNQLLTLMFGQLCNRESLRDLIVALNAHQEKCYHLGVGKHVTRSNLAKANESRDYRIFEDFAFYMISEARKKRVNDIFKLNGNVYAFDSTTIDLCLKLFPWATFRTHKGGVKIHTLYDVETQVPAFIHITEAKINDIKAMDVIPYESGSFYVFDRAYLVAIMQHDMKLDRSTYEVLQILGISLTDKTPLRDLFSKTKFNDVKEQSGLDGPNLFSNHNF